ncbi:MAG: hypothetical protein WC641_07550 [Patescibacteria group bacterium]
MRLTNEDVQPYRGGQMEIQNSGERYMYRGEIASIVVEGDELRVRFAWLAKGEGFPPIPKKWVKYDDLDYAVSLMFYAASKGLGDEDTREERIILNSSITGELVVIFPPTGSKLDPRKVEGLELARP